MMPMARPLFSVFVRYLVRFLLPASRRRTWPAHERTPSATPTYPTGNGRPTSLDSLKMLT
jgi:hypothetical protein